MLTCSSQHNLVSTQILKHLEDTTLESVEIAEGGRSYFRGSETTACGRRLYFARKGIKNDTGFSPRSRVKMRLGDVLHNWIRGEYIPEHSKYVVMLWGPDKKQEETITLDEQGMKIEGHFDGILCTPKKVKLSKKMKEMIHSPWLFTPKEVFSFFAPVAVLEIKTMGNWGFNQVCQKAFKDVDHYSYHYATQANRYIKAYNQKYPKNKVDQMCIFCFNTDAAADKLTSLPHRDYWFKFDKQLFDADMSFLKGVQADLDAGGTPDRAYNLPTDSFECRECPWTKQCWKENK